MKKNKIYPSVFIRENPYAITLNNGIRISTDEMDKHR